MLKSIYYTLKRIYYFFKRIFKRVFAPFKYKIKKNIYNLLIIILTLSGVFFVGAIINGENPKFMDSVKQAGNVVSKDVQKDINKTLEDRDIHIGTQTEEEAEDFILKTPSFWEDIKSSIKHSLGILPYDEEKHNTQEEENIQQEKIQDAVTSDAEEVTPDVSSQTVPYEIINENNPYLSIEEYYDSNGNLMSFQYYSDLDLLGRAGEALVLISKADMPEYERGSISEVKPSGWKLYNTKNTWGITLPDNSFYLYNRCHLIGFQLTGIDGEHCENSLLKKNLVTGTRYMNIGKMLDLENEIANYLRKNEQNYVLYKVTPLYKGVDLVPYGLQMQAISPDEKIKFNVIVYNIQLLDSGTITINYLNGNATYTKGE